MHAMCLQQNRFHLNATHMTLNYHYCMQLPFIYMLCHGKQKQPDWFEEINRMQLTIECSAGE